MVTSMLYTPPEFPLGIDENSTFEGRCVEALRPPALKTLLNVVQFLWSLMKFCLKKSNNFHAVDFSRVESMLAQGDDPRYTVASRGGTMWHVWTLAPPQSCTEVKSPQLAGWNKVVISEMK